MQMRRIGFWSLTAALASAPLAAQARDSIAPMRIDREGAIYTDRKGALRSHPAIAVERDSRIAFARLVRELKLDEKEPRDRHGGLGISWRNLR